VPAVRKTRRVFECRHSPHNDRIHVALDQVEQLGSFAEIELVITDTEQIHLAETRVLELAAKLGLNRQQPKSYLSMLLALAPQ
jgi:adenylate cyclase, class 2